LPNHRIEIWRDSPHFSANCSCGWASDDRPTAELALRDARTHGGSISEKVTVLDDPESDHIYELDVADAEVKHDVFVYWDHQTYSVTCSCGWEGPDTVDREAALQHARVHAKRDDVEVTDIGVRQDESAPNQTS
jgi:hypothetical protein